MNNQQKNKQSENQLGDNRMFDGVVWHDGLELGIEGRGWSDVEGVYDRLPARAKGVVPEAVWNFGHQAAGLSFRFMTDSDDIFARWRRVEPVDDREKEQSALRVGGMDCYGKAEDGKWYFLGTARPYDWPVAMVKVNVDKIDGKFREYRMNLPLGAAIDEVFVGVHEGARFERCELETRKPIVMYGSSIVHGACASRPGMTHGAIIERHVGVPAINLGFSGNARMEEAVVELIAEIDAALFVIDCLPNMGPGQVKANMVRLVEILRGRWEKTPILFIGDRMRGDGMFVPQRTPEQANRSRVQKKLFEELQAKGIKNLYHIEAQNFFGDDFDGTTDVSHPSDLGAMRMAEVLIPVIRDILGC